MDSLATLARWHENTLGSERELAAQAEYDRKVKAQKDAIAARVEQANEQLKAAGGKGFKLPKDPEKSYPEQTRADIKGLRDALARLEKAAPELPSAMGVEEGQIVEGKILVRGKHLTPGDPVARRLPLVLASAADPKSTAARTPKFGPDSSGRLELARWLVDGDHPLTARVMVNRIWRWHFGGGLVSTPDNFGSIGARPTHPELLDWLARRFVEAGWSIKTMHRLIMLSTTYRTGAAYDSRAAAVDPENRLRWRWTPRRLEAEAARDYLLAVGGTLDQAEGGPVLQVENRGYLFDHTSIDRTRYDSHRRSIYLPVIRNNLYNVFQLFDFSDPTVMSGDRSTTTVALQALFMMNGDLVHEAADRLAGRLLGDSGADDPERVRRLFETAYGRPPTASETARALNFIERYARAARGEEPDEAKRRFLAWRAYCQIVLASNEFIYIR
jgi:hypothetical protein